MNTIRCDHRDRPVPQCRKKARARIVYVCLDGRGFETLGSSVDMCWEHYLELENRARRESPIFRILKSVAL